VTKYRVTIWHDPDTENPGEYSLLRPVSFSNRHANFMHPDDIDPADFLFGLSYFEHGLCSWSLSGEGPSDPWDSVRNAGALVWNTDAGHDREWWDNRTPDEQLAAARAMAEEYTAWCNGDTYGYTVETLTTCDKCHVRTCGVVDSCGGFIGSDYMIEEVVGALAYVNATDIEIVGDFVPYGYEVEALTELVQVAIESRQVADAEARAEA
jgi:hypothetical protein